MIDTSEVIITESAACLQVDTAHAEWVADKRADHAISSDTDDDDHEEPQDGSIYSDQQRRRRKDERSAQRKKRHITIL